MVLCEFKKDPIDITYLLLGWYVLISDVPKEKIAPEKMEKLNEEEKNIMKFLNRKVTRKTNKRSKIRKPN